MLFTVWVSLAVLVRFFIVVELQPVCSCLCCTRAGMMSFYRRLCLWAKVGDRGAATQVMRGGEGREFPWGWKWAAGGFAPSTRYIILHTQKASLHWHDRPPQDQFARPTQYHTQWVKKQTTACTWSKVIHPSNLIMRSQECSFLGSKSKQSVL